MKHYELKNYIQIRDYFRLEEVTKREKKTEIVVINEK